MNTSTFTTRRSVEEMQTILNKREAREVAAQHAQELAAREATEAREEQRRITHEQLLNSSQEAINDLCQTVDDHYNGMVFTGKAYIRNESKVAAKQNELNLFIETADELYPVEEIDRTQEQKMKNCVRAYKLLPWTDGILAFLAIYPIMTNKLVTETLPFIREALIVAGAVISVGMGALLAMVSRLAVAGMNKNDSTIKKIPAYISVIILPMMYILGGFVFENGSGLIYNIVFAIVSFAIQCLIFAHFRNHVEAFAYFKKIDEVDKQIAKRESDERALREELHSTISERERLLNMFNQHYNDFCASFRNLVINYESHKKKFDKEASIPLNQIVIMVGNLQVFQEERLPLKRRTDGSIATMSSAIFGGTESCFNELQNGAINSLGIIDLMLRNANIGLPIPMPGQHPAIAEGQRGQNLIGEDNTVSSEAEASNDSVKDNNNDDIDMPKAWQ